MPGGLPQEHRGALAEQIQRQHPPKLPEASGAVLEEEARQKGEQGHMEQVDQPVEPVQLLFRADSGLDQVTQEHQPDEKKFEIAVVGAAQLDHG